MIQDEGRGAILSRVIWPLVLALAILFVLLFPLWATSAPQDSAVRIPSHGLSGVVIWTEQGRSLILTAGHGFAGQQRNRPIVLDLFPRRGVPMPAKRGPIRVLQVDYELDLVLIELPAGPVPFHSPVAPRGYRTPYALSVGFDKMRIPPVVVPTTLLGTDGPRQYTVQRPEHGRSGGPLLDARQNFTLGTVIGYELRPGGRGIYTSTTALWQFLDRYNRHTLANLDTPPDPPTVRYYSLSAGRYVDREEAHGIPFQPAGFVCPLAELAGTPD
jgi:hypothetical protein